MNGINFNDALNEKLKDPEFRKEWEASEAEYQMMRAVNNARIRNNLTQKQLAELSGISQADISRIENGNANPSISPEILI